MNDPRPYRSLDDGQLADELDHARRGLATVDLDAPIGLCELTAADLAGLSAPLARLLLQSGAYKAASADELRENTRAYWQARCDDLEAEARLRKRAGLVAPIGRYSPDVLDRLRAVDLPGLYAQLSGLQLRQVSAHAWRGPCASCGTSEHSSAFAAYCDPDGRWRWICYRLGHHGDTLKLAEELVRCDFLTAVGIVASFGGVPLPPPRARQDSPAAPPFDFGRRAL